MRWLGSRVVSVLNSGTEGPGFKSQSPRQTLRTHCASVHQAAKLVAALLRVAMVIGGQAESNGSLLCVSPARKPLGYRATALELFEFLFDAVVV